MSLAAAGTVSPAADGRVQARRTLLAAVLATVGMLFTAFAAAYLERKGAAAEWRRIEMPGLVWANTAVLLLASATLEAARRRGGPGWIRATLVLGLVFLAGQLAAWSQLAAAGVFLPTSPHASFFYILSGVHGVHVLGGLVALAVALRRRELVGLCAGYWHFLGLVWLYVLGVLLVL